MGNNAIITAAACIFAAVSFFYMMTQFDINTLWWHKAWIVIGLIACTMGAFIQFGFGFHAQ